MSSIVTYLNPRNECGTPFPGVTHQGGISSRHFPASRMAILIVALWWLTMARASADPFTRLQILLPGETAAPGTVTGKTGTPYLQITNVPFTVTVNAVDATWNLVSTNDTVRILSSSTNATLPASAALVAGTRVFTVTLKAAGFFSLTASNVTQPIITSQTSPDIVVRPPQPAAYTYNFTYANRQALLAAGWDFMARTVAGGARNTENTNAAAGPVISYNQSPGVLRIPIDGGDLWDDLNNSRNSLFRNLPFGWTSIQAEIAFAPTQPYQQANLALYQDDDNYIEISSIHTPAISMVTEAGGVPNTLTSVNLSTTNLFLRLDREVVYGDIYSFYSQNGSNWIYAGKINQDLVNPRLCIWGGGAQSGNPNLDVRRVQIATNATAITSTLALQPLALVFNSVVGQANTNQQRVNIYRRGPDAFNWSVSTNATWLSVSTAGGSIPGYCDVSVNTAGLTNGVYQAALSFKMLGAVTNTVNLPVTLIVNANNRARVATWKGGKTAAMSVWIDDSDTVMYNELVNAGFAGTYALMGPGAQLPLFTTYYNAGMELGAHTHNHYCYPLDEPTRRTQLENNIANIVTSTPQPQNRLTSFAWPCGANTTREKVWAADYFLISRGYNINQLEETSPQDWMNVKSYNSHEHTPFPPADLKTTVDAAIAQGKWLNLVFHSMNNDDGAVAYAVGKDIWVGTGGDVTRYIMQRDRTVISNYVQAANQLSFNCRRLGIPASNLRSFETAFNTNDPVTFQIAVTNLPPVIGVTVAGVARPFTISSSEGVTNLLFDAVVKTNAQSVVVTFTSLPVLTVTADNKTKVYREPNPTLTGSLAGVLPGDNITATFSTTATTTSSVGAYPITPVFSDPDGRLGNYYVMTNIGTLTITKSNTSITLGNLSQTYSGTARSVTATTVPSGLTVNFTYNGSSSAPVNAGSYTVIGTINNANYAGKATNTLVVARSNAPVTLGNLSQTYNGAARNATATTVPSGLTVNFTYNGSSSAPVNAGSYVVIGTIAHSNYMGSATNTLVIAPSNAPVSLGDLAVVYTGSGHSASASTIPSGLTVNLTYNSNGAAPTNAGSYEVIGIIVHSNYVGSATNTLVIAPSNALVTLGNLAAVYNGNGHSASATTVPGGLPVDLTYNGSQEAPTNAGSYEVIGTISDVNHVGSATNTMVITPSNAPIVLGDLAAIYTGSGHSASASTIPSGLAVNLTYASNSAAPTNAGSYEVIGMIVHANYVGSATNTLVITPGELQVVVNHKTRLFGQPNPQFSGSLFGLHAGDTITLEYSTAATEQSPVGIYDIVPTLVDAQGCLSNYLVAVTNGILKVVGAPRFISITRNPDGMVHLACEVYAGRTYEFQYKNDLDDAEWTPLVSGYTAIASHVEIVDDGAAAPQRFYRAVDISDP